MKEEWLVVAAVAAMLLNWKGGQRRNEAQDVEVAAAKTGTHSAVVNLKDEAAATMLKGGQAEWENGEEKEEVAEPVLDLYAGGHF